MSILCYWEAVALIKKFPFERIIYFCEVTNGFFYLICFNNSNSHFGGRNNYSLNMFWCSFNLFKKFHETQSKN